MTVDNTTPVTVSCEMICDQSRKPANESSGGQFYTAPNLVARI